jgi:hypothetical protein
VTRSRFITSVLVFLFIVTGVFLYLRSSYPDWDYNLLIGGNAFLALVTLLSFILATKPSHDRPEAFVRGVYGGTLVKLFLIAGGVLVYLLLHRHHLHKPSLAVIGGLYIIYTALETAALQRGTRTPRH